MVRRTTLDVEEGTLGRADGVAFELRSGIDTYNYIRIGHSIFSLSKLDVEDAVHHPTRFSLAFLHKFTSTLRMTRHKRFTCFAYYWYIVRWRLFT